MTGTILIVEDDLLVAEQVQAAVLSMGYAAPTIARSGTEALLAITETQPALVLIDIRLKGEMSGIQVAAFLREHHGIPVVYVSSLVDDETLRRARDTAPHRYVVKPFTADDIRAAVEVALYRAQLDAALLDMSGFLGVVGTDGALDLVAQGGGGGGGAKGGTGANQCPNQAGTKGGASGGSGGAGGRGGTPGGASIALVSLNATFAFADVTLTAGNGGNGGQGGDGQQGGSPGAVGNGGTAHGGLNPACSGALGGIGGTGGTGGGGLGGHSLAIAFVGSSPAMEGATSAERGHRLLVRLRSGNPSELRRR